MTDEELKTLVASLAAAQIKTEESFAETKAQINATNEQMKRTDAKLERMGINLGNLNQNIGYTTEEYFYNSLYDNPRLGNIQFDSISKNLHWKTNTVEDEFDIIMYNGDSIALIECKYKAHENDLLKLIHKKVENFRAISDDYRNFTIYLGLASYYFYPELEQLAKEKGVALLKQKGDVVQIDAAYLKAY